MARSDRERWDRRYAASGTAPAAPDGPEPPPALAPFEDLFPTGGSALDVACGPGRAAVWLADRGLRVWGVDVSAVGIRQAQVLAAHLDLAHRCRFDVVDLDDGLPSGPPVDVLLCHLFRDTRLYRAMLERLAPGGLLAVVLRSEVGGEPGRFNARPGELRDAFGHLDVVTEGEGRGRAWVLARKPDS